VGGHLVSSASFRSEESNRGFPENSGRNGGGPMLPAGRPEPVEGETLSTRDARKAFQKSSTWFRRAEKGEIQSRV